nr:GntR family transcriptional regulator [Thalassobacillus sp. CUG 92003]
MGGGVAVSKINSLSIRESVFEHIRKEILNQNLEPGEKLIESELAAELGVSRTPIREALHKLELEGLVAIFPRRHCQVVGVTHESIKEIHLIRSQLEPLAARYAVNNLSNEDLKYLESLVDKSVKASELRNVEELVKVNDEFHQTITKASNLQRIIKILENMHDYVVSFRYSFMAREELAERSINEHRAILHALMERDKEKVEELAYKHLKGISEYEDVIYEDMKRSIHNHD